MNAAAPANRAGRGQIFRAIALAAGLAAASVQAAGFELEWARVPDRDVLPADIYHGMFAEKQGLDEQRRATETAVRAFNAECGRVPKSDAARLAACGAKRTPLLANIASYKKTLADFHARLSAAAQAHSDAAMQAALAKDRAGYKSQLQKTMSEIDRAPLPDSVLTEHEFGIITGLFTTDEENRKLVATSQNPFTGRDLSKALVFATTDRRTSTELARGVIDNQTLAEYTLQTPYGRELAAKLEGKHFKRLVAHSNGATVAEALILKGVIKVDELNVVGGDRSISNNPGLQDLIASGRVNRVVVWVNPGDAIPIGSALGTWTKLGLTQRAENASRLLARYATGSAGGDTKVRYCVMRGPHFDGQTVPARTDEKFFEPHYLSTYFSNMGRHFSQQGSADRNCTGGP